MPHASASAGGQTALQAGRSVGRARPATDEDAVVDTYRFLRTEADDAALDDADRSLARKYDRALFKDFAICDLWPTERSGGSRIGLRWRTEPEVVAGKGTRVCGEVRCHSRGDGAAAPLSTFEVPFAYQEAGERKSALVRLRLCPPCADRFGAQRESRPRKGTRRRKRRRHEDPKTPRTTPPPSDAHPPWRHSDNRNGHDNTRGAT